MSLEIKKILRINSCVYVYWNLFKHQLMHKEYMYKYQDTLTFNTRIPYKDSTVMGAKKRVSFQNALKFNCFWISNKQL